ncbi:MAG: hypothetical protein ACI4DY_12035 [Monoglobaceae bacterium]
MMFLYKNNRFYLNNISFCLPDNVYLNTDCDEYDDCIELLPNGEDFRIIIYDEYCDGGAKQFFGMDEAKECYCQVGELRPITIGNVHGYACTYNSTYNTYQEYRFDTIEEKKVFGIIVHGKIPLNIDNALTHSATSKLLNSLKL